LGFRLGVVGGERAVVSDDVEGSFWYGLVVVGVGVFFRFQRETEPSLFWRLERRSGLVLILLMAELEPATAGRIGSFGSINAQLPKKAFIRAMDRTLNLPRTFSSLTSSSLVSNGFNPLHDPVASSYN